jgi:hypothetical protein
VIVKVAVAVGPVVLVIATKDGRATPTMWTSVAAWPLAAETVSTCGVPPVMLITGEVVSVHDGVASALRLAGGRKSAAASAAATP